MKFDDYNDGLIILPQFHNYDTVATYLFWVKYGSQYPDTTTILIYDRVESELNPLELQCGAGFQDIQVADVNGDGRDEIVKINYGEVVGDSTSFNVQIYGYPETGNSLQTLGSLSFRMNGKHSNFHYTSPDRFLYYYGDFTGEGRVQMMVINASINGSNLHTKILDLGTGQTVFDGTTFDPVASNTVLFAYDVDGDGVSELCRATSTYFEAHRFNQGGMTTTLVSSELSYSTLQDMVAMGDLNGDGYIDIVCAPHDSTKLNCYSYHGGINFYYHNLLSNYDWMAGDTFFITDINQDGYGDIVRRRENTICVFVSELASFSPQRIAQVSFTDSVVVIPANVADYSNSYSLLTLYGLEVNLYSYGYNRSQDRLLTSMTDSYGNCQYNSYQDITTENASYSPCYTRTYSSSNGYVRKTVPLLVLYEEGTTPYQKNSFVLFRGYSYSDAVFHLRGLGFCGFGEILMTDSSNNDVTGASTLFMRTVYDPQNSGVASSVTRRISSEINGPLVDTTSYVYTKVSHPYRKNTPRLDSVIVIDNLGGFKTSTGIAYDAYDCVTSQHTEKTALDASSGDGLTVTQHTSNQYSHQISDTDSLWILGNVTLQTVTKYNDYSDQGWQERTTYTYSIRKNKPNMALTYVGMIDDNEGIHTANNLLSEIHYTYDTHGNVISEQSAPYGGTTLHGSTYTYDAQGRFLLSETDAAGLTTSYSGYNIFGKPTTVTDPRGNVTSYTYDNWGNPISVSYPGGRVDNTTYSWALNAILGSLYKITVSGNASPTQTTWYSSLGQELRTGVKRFNGDIIYTDRQYSNGGLLLHESLPYKNAADTIRWSSVHYDSYGRIDTLTAASGAITSYWRNGSITVTTKEGIASAADTGPDGSVTHVLDPGGRIKYYYRPDGQPSSLQVAVGGTILNPTYATTQFTYDAYGRRTSVIDPSAGTRSDAYTDNADGSSSVVHTTANGTITTHRDYLGRVTLVQRHDNGSVPVPEEPEERARRINDTLVASTATAGRNPSSDRSANFNTTYTYNSYGDLVSAVSNNGTSTYYTYDTYGRIATQRENIPGSQWLQRSFSYDTAGRVASTAYTTGSGISVTESYTYTNGYHTATTAMNSTVWQLQSENALGQPTLAYTGSAIRRYGYDVYGFPVRRELESAEGATTMDFRYGYDHPTGNMTWREDATREATEEDFVRESFTYDGLNRLTSMGDNLLSDPRDVTYSNSGNVTSIDGNGDFYYPNNQSSHPYRISGGDIGEYAWCPDPNISLGYTAYDRPMYITGATGQVEFTYNDAGERVSAISSTYVGGEQSYITNWCRYYIGGQYEREVINNTTRETLWLGGDAYSAPMIFYRENNTGGALYNIGRDVQGSITHLASADGTLLQEYSYDPWGRQRNPGTHAFATYGPLPSGEEPEECSRTTTTITIPVLHRGYCAHEHLEQFGLINMNARLYDPFTGRFYSPDPYVQMPDFSQSFNRYAYCLNNPLKYEDESGEFFVVDSFIIGLLSGGFEKGRQMARNDYRIWKGLVVTDENKSIGGRVWELVSRFTWQLPQTIGGFLTAQSFNTFCLKGGVESVDYLYGATVVKTRDDGEWGVTQGSFIVGSNGIAADPNNSIFQHEYGHYLQSQEMGLGYYSRVGIPSLLSRSAERHRFHPVEQDANRRAFEYFSKHVDGFYENSLDPLSDLGWHFGYYDNPILVNGVSLSLTSYNSPDDVWALFDSMKIRTSIFDIISWSIPLAETLLTGLMNAAYYNFYRY